MAEKRFKSSGFQSVSKPNQIQNNIFQNNQTLTFVRPILLFVFQKICSLQEQREKLRFGACISVCVCWIERQLDSKRKQCKIERQIQRQRENEIFSSLSHVIWPKGACTHTHTHTQTPINAHNTDTHLQLTSNYPKTNNSQDSIRLSILQIFKSPKTLRGKQRNGVYK